MGNRTRSVRLQVYLTEKEMKDLNNKIRRTGLTKSTYIRKIIKDIQPKERPPTDFFEVLKVLRQISINMNQIALKANAIGFINAEAYWENSRRLQEAISDLKRQITFMD